MRICPNCGNECTRKRSSKYCSRKCYTLHVRCVICGAPRHSYTVKGQPPLCRPCKDGLYPETKIARFLSRALKKALNGNARLKWDIVGYTKEQYAKDIFSKMTPEMKIAIKSPGQIHIDHIRPLWTFNRSDPTWIKRAYALSNLRPVWAKDNLSKGGKWNGEIDKGVMR